MHREGTPAHKRVARAEKGREEWKMKAIERREEAEKLKLADERKSKHIEELLDRQNQLEKEISKKNKIIDLLEDKLKKKNF